MARELYVSLSTPLKREGATERKDKDAFHLITPSFPPHQTPPWRGWDQPTGICASLGLEGWRGGAGSRSVKIHSLLAGVSTPMQDKWGNRVARWAAAPACPPLGGINIHVYLH